MTPNCSTGSGGRRTLGTLASIAAANERAAASFGFARFTCAYTSPSRTRSGLWALTVAAVIASPRTERVLIPNHDALGRRTTARLNIRLTSPVTASGHGRTSHTTVPPNDGDGHAAAERSGSRRRRLGGDREIEPLAEAWREALPNVDVAGCAVRSRD